MLLRTPLLPRWAQRLLAARRFKSQGKFKSLGAILQQGKVGQAPAKELQAVPGKQNYMEDFVDFHGKELEDSSLVLGYMSKNDIEIQHAFDQGRQFGSTALGLVMKRTVAAESLPDEIDLVETPWAEIERVYKTLAELDNDSGVHHKYKKRLLIDTTSLIAVRRRKLNDMCRMARRDERPPPQLFDHSLGQALDSVYLYNVVGFDCSLSGAPLMGAKSLFKNKSTPFPKELLADCRPFETKVPIHKKEVNFMEDDALEETIMPQDALPNSTEEILRMEGRPIMVDSVDGYNGPEHLSAALRSQLEERITRFQRLLAAEISQSTISLFLRVGRELKRSEYVLVAKVPFASKYTGPTFKFVLKHFDLVPFYGSLLTSIKHRRALTRHLTKVVLINIREQVDSLTRIKYKLPDDRKAFLAKTLRETKALVRSVLVPMAEHEKSLPMLYDAIVHKPTPGSFLRLYWLRKPHRGRRDYTKGVRRQARRLDIGYAGEV